jgi:ribosome biogenesis SPOUT family RNA methylase Rps3
MMAKKYIVEHLDPELGPWSALEYQAIAEECATTGSQFILSSVPPSLQVPKVILDVTGTSVEHRSVEEVYASQKDRICLLDPAAHSELTPGDGQRFDSFLFGGILGTAEFPNQVEV